VATTPQPSPNSRSNAAAIHRAEPMQDTQLSSAAEFEAAATTSQPRRGASIDRA